VTPGRTGTYHPHFQVLLIVPAEYFESGALLYIGRAEWRVMREQCLRADGRRIVKHPGHRESE
jgi:Replication protein